MSGKATEVVKYGTASGGSKDIANFNQPQRNQKNNKKALRRFSQALPERIISTGARDVPSNRMTTQGTLSQSDAPPKSVTAGDS